MTKDLDKEVKKLINRYSNLLVDSLESSCSDKLLGKILKAIDEFHRDIDKGLLR
jgi:hypothetical protein